MSNNNKVVRNPSPEEIEIVNKRNMAPAKPKTPQPQISQPAGDNGLKESKNPFEPQPFECILPSNQLVVPTGKIYIRRMTTIEEQMFTDIAFKYIKNDIQSPEMFMKAMTDVLNNCIRSKIEVSKLLIIDKIPLLLNVLTATYGSTFNVDFVCPHCAEKAANEVSFNEIQITQVPTDIEYPRRIEVLKSFEFPVTLYLQYPTIEYESLWLKETPNVLSMFYALISDVEGTLPDGSPITMAYAKTIAENLHPDDKTLLKNFISEFGEYGAKLEVTKEACKNKSCSMFAQPQPVAFDLEHLLFKIFQ